MITTRADAPHHNHSLLPALPCPPPPSPPHNTQNATTTQQQQQKRSLIARQPLLFSNLVKVHARCPFLYYFFCHALCPLVSCWLSCAPTACINTHTWRICPHQEFWNLPGLVLHAQKSFAHSALASSLFRSAVSCCLHSWVSRIRIQSSTIPLNDQPTALTESIQAIALKNLFKSVQPIVLYSILTHSLKNPIY